jgi:hypothetical protein
MNAAPAADAPNAAGSQSRAIGERRERAHARFEREVSVSRPPFATIPERRVPVLVVIAPGDLLLDACYETMHYVVVGRVIKADLKSATTVVAAHRPFAIVFEEDVFAFDPREFKDLGRDVGAEIVTVPAEASHDALVSRLLPELKAAFRRWERKKSSSST